jgi:Tol biopolymer transport system component
MRNAQIAMVFLAFAMGACSGGGGSGSLGVDDPGAAGGSGGNPPPAQTSQEPPPDSRTEPPFPSVPRPPVETLTCNPCKKIAFVSSRDFNSEIYSVNADGTDLARLTNDPSIDLEPAWSPDGQRIAFTSDRHFDGSGPTAVPNLYVMDADGSNVTRLTSSPSGARDPAWSPDGSRIVYYASSDGSNNLWQVSSTGGIPQLLFSTPGFDRRPAWSPDGTRLILVSDWFAYDAVNDIFQINSDGSGFTALTDGIVFDQINYDAPSWSPNGERIALIVQRDFLELDDNVNWLGVMSPDGSGLMLLLTPRLDYSSGRTYPTEHFYDPSWSPDGTTIAYTHFVFNSRPQYRVSWVKADGSASGTIITNGSDPDWQR